MVAISLLLGLSWPSPAVFAARERDWRNGPIVYQVFVDRFAPSANLDAKRALYTAPRSLHPWSETPKAGTLNREAGLWSHELAFWGGDLKSVRSRVGYVKDLGADVLYLNPIVEALSNHKYDAMDYEKVAPEYGTRQDVTDLAGDLHAHGMRLMLDGVFNHMGKSSPKFQSALKDPNSPYRSWYEFGKQYPAGYQAWANVANLPELRLENPAVREHLWNGSQSVVQKYLKEGVDGWRLDVAFEIGPKYLSELTQAAHRAKPGSMVVGEVWNYPEGWMPAMDGIMNFHFGRTVTELAQGHLKGPVAARMVERTIRDTGLEPLLKSWVVLDNHDTQRLANFIPDLPSRHLAQVLQFTLPGAPVIYYGTELGMQGGGDPENRAPMRWDLATKDNPELAWMRQLVAARKQIRSLRIGDYRLVESDQLFAFLRVTDNVSDTAIVVANPTGEPVHERLPVPDGRIMNGTNLVDHLSRARGSVFAGFLDIEVPAKTVRVFTPITKPVNGYTPYKRVIG